MLELELARTCCKSWLGTQRGSCLAGPRHWAEDLWLQSLCQFGKWVLGLHDAHPSVQDNFDLLACPCLPHTALATCHQGAAHLFYI
jgi:hypothetical protein